MERPGAELSIVAGGSATDAITVNGTSNAVAFNGSYGTSGQILSSNGSGSANTWLAQSSITAGNATNVAVTDNTSTNATYYPTFVSNNTGNLGVTVSSTKLKFNPSTGALTASQLVIAP